MSATDYVWLIYFIRCFNKSDVFFVFQLTLTTTQFIVTSLSDIFIFYTCIAYCLKCQHYRLLI
jgi:hypothetical protein